MGYIFTALSLQQLIPHEDFDVAEIKDGRDRCRVKISLDYIDGPKGISERCRYEAGGGRAPPAALKPPCADEDCGKTGALIKGDIGLVMEKLGISRDDESSEEERKLVGSSLGEISNMFDEIEPSFGELKEAFDIFDGNKDGYIDAKDLQRILFALGFVEFSESECQEMIVFNNNNALRSTRIDFRHFVKIIEDSFS